MGHTQPIPRAGPDWRIALALFLFSLCLVEWLNGDRFQLSLDEGIYLDGASRVAKGQAPYRDFFTFTGPVTFWSYGAVFHLFGATFANARFVLSAEIALLSAIIYWLAAILTSRTFAAGIGLLFAAFCLESSGNLYITHRWDSNLWALAAVALACAGLGKPNRARGIASGVCAALAAWTTPPFIVIIPLIAAWMAWAGGFRGIRDFLSGVAAPSLAAAGVLLYQRALEPMSTQLLWATSHYGGPNRVPYGYVVKNPLAGPHALGQLTEDIVELTPALLPVLAYVGLAALMLFSRKRLQQHKEVLVLFVIFSAGVLLAGLPRIGAHQLLFLSPVFWVLAGYVVFSAAGQNNWLTPAVALLTSAMLISAFGTNRKFTEVVETNAGAVRCTPQDGQLVSALVTRIGPGDTLFVFPYLPVVYFLAGGENPSRFSFLQPGMMTRRDEADVVSELRAHPPQWMLWAQFPPRFWMEIWPHTNPASLDFPTLEKYMSANYREVLRVKMSDQQMLVLGCAKDCGIIPGGAIDGR